MKKRIGLGLGFILLLLGFCDFKMKTTVSLGALIANSERITLIYCEETSSTTACDPIEITEEDTIQELSLLFQEDRFTRTFFFSQKTAHDIPLRTGMLLLIDGNQTWNLEIYGDSTLRLNYQAYSTGWFSNSTDSLLDRIEQAYTQYKKMDAKSFK